MRRGFTLIELMVVVAIIGLLASIAAPSLNGSMMRARRAEISIVRNGIDKSARDTFLRNDFRWPGYSGVGNQIDLPWNPFMDPSSLSPTPGECTVGPPAPWNTTAAWDGWKMLDFVPEGLLRGRYIFQYAAHNTNADYYYHTISVSDLDSDGICAGHFYEWLSGNGGSWTNPDGEITYGLTGLIGEDEY